jgi:hypothetical protein
MDYGKQERICHLELIQGVITRMSQNSFLCKGWSVSVVAVLFALAAKDANERYALLAVLPAVAFWSLDAYYLRQERMFRGLYDAVRLGTLDSDPFTMAAAQHVSPSPSWWSLIWSITVAPLHGSILLILLAVVGTCVLRAW